METELDAEFARLCASSTPNTPLDMLDDCSTITQGSGPVSPYNSTHVAFDSHGDGITRLEEANYALYDAVMQVSRGYQPVGQEHSSDSKSILEEYTRAQFSRKDQHGWKDTAEQYKKMIEEKDAQILVLQKQQDFRLQLEEYMLDTWKEKTDLQEERNQELKLQVIDLYKKKSESERDNKHAVAQAQLKYDDEHAKNQSLLAGITALKEKKKEMLQRLEVQKVEHLNEEKTSNTSQPLTLHPKKLSANAPLSKGKQMKKAGELLKKEKRHSTQKVNIRKSGKNCWKVAWEVGLEELNLEEYNAEEDTLLREQQLMDATFGEYYHSPSNYGASEYDTSEGYTIPGDYEDDGFEDESEVDPIAYIERYMELLQEYKSQFEGARTEAHAHNALPTTGGRNGRRARARARARAERYGLQMLAELH